MTFARRQNGADVTRVRSGWLRGVCIGVVVLISAAPARAVEITGVSPNYGWNSTMPRLTVTGSGLLPGATIKLTRPGEPDVVAIDVIFVSMAEIKPKFDLNGAKAGRWDLAVNDAVLPDAVAIKQAFEIKRLSAWGGPVQAMQVVGNIGYVARGSGMVILDVTDPSNMIELSSLDLESHGVYDVAVAGNYAFVCGDDNYLSVVDVSDSVNPSLVVNGLHPFGGSGHQKSATDIAIYQATAYVNFRWNLWQPYGCLYALDISDPESLADATPASFHGVQEPTSTNHSAIALATDGDYLHVVTAVAQAEPADETQLYVYDLAADPLAPTFVAAESLFVPSDRGNIAISVDAARAYVTVPRWPGDWHMVVVDVSNPADPVVIGFLSPADLELGSPRDIAVSNGIAYVADFDYGSAPWDRVARGLAIVDLTNLLNPALLGTYRTHGSVFGLTLTGTTAYLMDRGEGVIAIDVSNPEAPVRLGNWHSPAFIQNIEQEGDLLYFSDWWNGITALDVSDPSAPTLVGVHQTDISPPYTGDNGYVRVQNGFAYLAAGYKGLEVVDFADPANPLLVGGYQPPDQNPDYVVLPTAQCLAVKDNVLVVDGYDGSGTGARMWTFDINDPGNPVLGSSDHVCIWHDEWAITDDFLAVGCKDHNLDGLVRDVADPYNVVTLAGGCAWEEGAITILGSDLFVEGNRIYVAHPFFSESGRFNVYEIHRTGDEVDVPLVAEFIVGSASGVGVQNGIAYVVGEARSGTNCLGNPTFHLWGVTAYDVVNLENGANWESNKIAVGPPVLWQQSVHADLPYVFTGGPKPGWDNGAGLVTFQTVAPGSVETDGDVDLIDFAGFENCFGAPGGPAFDPDCTPFDFDEDGDVDNDDFAAFQAGITGPF